jgi:hypothetical protein
MIERGETGATAHPSYLELDRMALGAPDAGATQATAAHVTACERCRRHLDGLEDVPPMPAALRARLVSELNGAAATGNGLLARLLAGRRTRLYGATALAGAMAVAAAVVWVGGGRAPGPDAPAGRYDGIKGLPSVWIYVKHESELALWDGERPLAPGDRFRLKIDPQDLTHVDVFTADDTGDAELRPVWSGELAPGVVTTLPPAWQLDGDGRRESLIVVLARRAVSAAAAKRFAERGAPAGVWLRRFELRPAPPAERGRPPAAERGPAR